MLQPLKKIKVSSCNPNLLRFSSWVGKWNSEPKYHSTLFSSNPFMDK